MEELLGMTTGKKIGLVLLGLFICLYIGGLIYTNFIMKPPDQFNGMKPDIGEGLKLNNTGMTYIESMIILGDTPYEAMVGSYRDDYHSDPPWKGFLVAVNKKVEETVADEQVVVGYPFFSRWIPGKDVPLDLWRKEVDAIVSYDEESRVITFDLGFTNYVCKLPPQ